VLTKEGQWPGIQYLRVAGHEIAGIIDEVGAGDSTWNAGWRVGVGWYGGRDNTCVSCRRACDPFHGSKFKIKLKNSRLGRANNVNAASRGDDDL